MKRRGDCHGRGFCSSPDSQRPVARRRRIRELQAQLTALQGELTLAAEVSCLEDAKTDAGDLRDEEQEYHDNMPESLQQGDRGQAAEAAAQALDEAADALGEVQEAIEDLSDKVQEALDKLDEATGG